VSRIAGAQPSSGVASSKKGTRLITLGTRSGPNPTVWRAQSSNLLIVNGALYVVDAGDGITRRLTRAGIVMRDIDTMFITHPHSDHTGGLPALLQVQYDSIRTKPVNIYGPPGTEAIVKALVQYLDVDAEVRISDGTRTLMPSKLFSGHDQGTGTVFQDANIKVTAVENSHFNFAPEVPATASISPTLSLRYVRPLDRIHRQYRSERRHLHARQGRRYAGVRSELGRGV
jgi:ribonuclease BN (tRNA processing enzyme)